MRKLFFIILVLIFVSGCFHLTPKGIIKNPDRVVKECGKIEDVNMKIECFNKYAKDVSMISKDTSISICNNLASGYPKNKCLFNVFSTLEGKGKLEDGIEVCKHIDKEGFLEFCESRRNGGSIMVAPSLA